jgi:hypothetical protein
MTDHNPGRPSAADRLAAVPWGIVLVLLAAAIGACWYFFAPAPNPEAAPAAREGGPTAAPEGVPAAPDASSAAGLQIGMHGTALFGALNGVLTGVVDAESAEKAVPKIDNLSAQLEDLKNSFQQLSDEQRQALAEFFSKSRTSLVIRLEQVLKIPGVSEILSERFEKLEATLDAFQA